MRTEFQIAIGLAIVLWASVAGAHSDSAYLTDPCGSCHVGHGLAGEPMLQKSEEEFCYQCHGSAAERDRMVREGKLLDGAPLADIEAEFSKLYRHPVEQSGQHSPVEELPLLGRGNTGHAECVDCHAPHRRVLQRGAGNQGVAGFTMTRQVVQDAGSEVEVCLKCHADPRQLQGDREPLLEAFGAGAVSQHPVTRPARRRGVSSLTSDAAGMTTMTCSDCHTSDDDGGPRGPHGSRFEFLLSGNYVRDDYVTESPFTYEFCYSCHDRSKVLADESFEFHSLHILGAEPGQGTSCFTCHASHGSTRYRALLRFATSAVSPESSTRRLEFVDLGQNEGACWLSCHGVDHAGSSYRGGF